MLRIYNTLSRKKEVFLPHSISKRLLRGRPKKRKSVNFFVCGPTTYDFSHLGHARTYLVFDMLAKYLKTRGYDVFYLQNITDLDDKILVRAKKEKIPWKVLSKKFEKEYLKDIKTLNITSITKYARATNHITEIQNQVKKLLEKGVAYQIEDGVYYDIKKFKDYGKLSRRTILQAEDAVSRIDEAKEKKNRGDFCLWKFSKPGEPRWPFDKLRVKAGRPGWHIEDTAITEKYFGPQYDIHGGAKDLIFPHHEAEIAQMEAISGEKPLAKYWLHTGFLTVNGIKMAKSLRNYIAIKDFLTKYSPRILRFLILKSHYRSPIDYSEKGILQVKKQLERIDEFVDKLQETRNKEQRTRNRKLVKNLISKARGDFEKAMEDDLNTPKAIALIFQLISKGNKLLDKEKLTKADERDILEFLKKIDKIFSFIFWGRIKKEEVPKEILKLVKKRENFRQKGNYKKADEIRRKIKQMGYRIEDARGGPKIKKI